MNASELLDLALRAGNTYMTDTEKARAVAALETALATAPFPQNDYAKLLLFEERARAQWAALDTLNDQIQDSIIEEGLVPPDLLKLLDELDFLVNGK